MIVRYARSFILFFVLAVISISIGSTIRADKMDLDTHTLVINKLTIAIKNLPKNDVSVGPSLLRLADLYSERARLQLIKEVETNCNNCKQSKEDRKSALFYYQKALPTASTENKAKIIVQMAHLNKTLGNIKESKKLYHQIISDKKHRYPSHIIGQAYLNLVDIYYSEANFKRSMDYFQKGANLIPHQKGYALYRIAWCYLNTGKLEKAQSELIYLLKNHNLLIREATGGPAYDVSFHSDVANDLATFFARGVVKTHEIRTLYNLTPDATKKSTMIYFAKETERLGQKDSSISIWHYTIKNQELTDLEKLEAQTRLAQLRYDLRDRKGAIEELQTAINLWKDNGCNEKEECDLLKTRLRLLVVNGYKREKKSPSSELLSLYQIYLSQFNKEAEIHLWSAQIARHLKNWEVAIKSYRNASVLAYKDPKNKELFENSLLGEIEVAELSKNKDHRLSAYEHYLKLNPKGKRVLEVNYQIAQVYYEKAQYDESSSRFYSVALTKDTKQHDLRKKAADLALDSLVILKDHKKIEDWSNQFAKIFPSAKLEYIEIGRKAAINQVADKINDKSTSRSVKEATLIKLKSINLAGASSKEKQSIYENQIIVAQSLQDYSEAQAAASRILALPNLSEKDKNEAIEQKIWFAEMQFDFKTAYTLSRKAKYKKLSKDARHLRLGILAELANLPSRKHYVDYIESTKDVTTSNYIRAKLVKKARSPLSELKKHKKYLKKSPQIYAPLLAELYAKYNKRYLVDEILKYRSLRNNPSVQPVLVSLEIDEAYQALTKLKRHRLKTRGDKNLKRTLSQRLSLLSSAEKDLKSLAKKGQLTAQIITLSTLKDQYSRLYKELLRLPTPKGLNKAQRAQYKVLLANQAEPYLKISKEAEQKLAEIWSNTHLMERLSVSIKNSSSPVVKLIHKEIKTLMKYAPSSQKRELHALLLERPTKPTSKELREARKAVAQNPMGIKEIKHLQSLEEAMGRDVMVAYLDSRIQRAKLGDKQ